MWRLLVEVLEELQLVDRSIGVVGHGCYTQIITTADVEFLQCLHGRAPAVATGMKRMLPDRAIYTLQGDGDMVSEGLAEVLHAAAVVSPSPASCSTTACSATPAGR